MLRFIVPGLGGRDFGCDDLQNRGCVFVATHGKALINRKSNRLFDQLPSRLAENADVAFLAEMGTKKIADFRLYGPATLGTEMPVRGENRFPGGPATDLRRTCDGMCDIRRRGENRQIPWTCDVFFRRIFKIS